MSFTKGQQIVCIQEDFRRWGRKDAPKMGDIVTYNGPCLCGCIGHILLKEYNQDIAYRGDRFSPLMDITELTEILEQQPEHA